MAIVGEASKVVAGHVVELRPDRVEPRLRADAEPGVVELTSTLDSEVPGARRGALAMEHAPMSDTKPYVLAAAM